MSSVLDLIVPASPLPSELKRLQTDALFRDLRHLKAACGAKANKNDVAVILITACLDHGLNFRARIVGALTRVGLNELHVVNILNRETGDDPATSRWSRDGADRYRLHLAG